MYQNTLARRAGVSLTTVSRMERGIKVEVHNAEAIVKCLGLRFVENLANAQLLVHTPAKSPPPGHKFIELTLGVTPGSAGEKEQIAANAAEELRRQGTIRNVPQSVNTLEGSIRIILQVDDEDAERLLEAFRRGDLAYLDVTNVREVSSRNPPPPSRNWFFVFGLLGLAFGLLAFIPPIRIPACTLGLVLSSVGLFFAHRRKSRWIVPAIAAGVNAGALALALYMAFSKPSDTDNQLHQGEGSQKAEGPLPNPDNIKEDTAKSGDTSKVATPKEPQKPDKPKEDTKAKTDDDEEIEKAIEKVKDADLMYDDAPVVIDKEVITALVKWGDVTRLAEKGFKPQPKGLRPNMTGLKVVVNCGTETNYLGDKGGYSIFSCPAAIQGVALREGKARLVVFVPFVDDGFGEPSIVKESPDRDDMRYATPSAGYLLVKIK